MSPHPMSIAALMFAAATLSLAPAPPQAPCQGCIGTGGPPDTDTEAMCDVTISVNVHSSVCVPAGATCVGSPCEVTVTRSWTLPIGTQIDFCHKHGGTPPWLCTAPPHKAGHAMHAESAVEFEDMRCGGMETYRISATACGRTLVAQVVGACSACP